MHKPKIKIEYCYCDECMKEARERLEDATKNKKKLKIMKLN